MISDDQMTFSYYLYSQISSQIHFGYTNVTSLYDFQVLSWQKFYIFLINEVNIYLLIHVLVHDFMSIKLKGIDKTYFEKKTTLLSSVCTKLIY